jgi:glycosyltransferase involved in cell wall biosynthesis
MANELVSVIITTYRRPVEILKRAVESVLNQTYSPIEIYVVNDAPEEKELSKSIGTMLEAFADENIHYLIQEKNAGACKARNDGIKTSKGTFIALLDDDDEWLPEKTEHQMRGFTSPEIGMVYSQYYDVEGEKKSLRINSKKSGDLLDDVLRQNCLGGCSMSTIRREVFEKCGYFDERFRSLQDFDMWIRIAQKYQINCVDEPLLLRHVQAVSITSNNAARKQGFELLMEKYKDLYEGKNDILNYRYAIWTKDWISRGEFKEARHTWKKAIEAKRFSKDNLWQPLKGFGKYLLSKKR